MRLFPIIRVRDLNRIMMFTRSRAKLLLPFTCNFHYSYYSLRIVVIFFTAIINIGYPPLHSTNDGLRKSRCVTGRCFLIYLRLMQNTLTLFRRHRKCVMAIRLLRCRRVTRCLWMRVRNRDWWQSPLPKKCDAFFPPSFLISVLLKVRVTSFMYVTSACALWSERQYCD